MNDAGVIPRHAHLAEISTRISVDFTTVSVWFEGAVSPPANRHFMRRLFAAFAPPSLASAAYSPDIHVRLQSADTGKKFIRCIYAAIVTESPAPKTPRLAHSAGNPVAVLPKDKPLQVNITFNAQQRPSETPARHHPAPDKEPARPAQETAFYGVSTGTLNRVAPQYGADSTQFVSNNHPILPYQKNNIAAIPAYEIYLLPPIQL